jgi:hypothetical protein
MRKNIFGYLLAIVLVIILICIIVRQIKEHHLQDDPMLMTLKEVLRPIMYNGKSIVDGMKLYKSDKSFTINKSQTFMCLYDREGQYYPLNQLVYVLLHERAHSLNHHDVGHTPAFHAIFDQLLESARQLGIYNPSIPIIPDYCE